jgi:hypothetical protein
VWVVVAIVAGAGVLAAGSLGGGAAAACPQHLCLDDRLPAPLTITTARATFLIARDGRVQRAAGPRGMGPPGAAVFPATGSWYAVRRAHLVIGRNALTLWRSSDAGWSAKRIGVVVAGRRELAFQYDHKLYMGRVDGGVHDIARSELPLGWTARGLYTYSYPRRELLLRKPTGRVLTMISPLPFHADPFVANGSLYFIVRGVLMRARGVEVHRVASLAALGMSTDSWVAPLGGLLEVMDNRHLMVVRPDGSRFASTPLPRRGGETESLSSPLVPGPRANAVAFTAAYGESTDPRAAMRAGGTETVYLLPSGARAAIPVHTERVRFRVCERGAGLDWNGSWLLYDNSEGNLVMIDTAGSPRAIDLTADAAHLTGTRIGVDAHWTGRAS